MSVLLPIRARLVTCSFGLISAATLALGVTSCKPKIEKHLPPRHSVALASPVRGAVRYTPPGAKGARSAQTDVRVEAGGTVSTPGEGRATLALDDGGSLLLDHSTTVRLDPAGVLLSAGRAFVDARGATVRVRAGGGTVKATDATFAVRATNGGAEVYCAAAEVTLTAGDKTLRLVSGMTARLGPQGITPKPEVVWDDWTGGLAQAGPLAPRLPAGVGVLQGRTTTEWGRARAPLLVREHRVEATVRGDLVITRVRQEFFNPRSATVEGTYRVRLPAGAILSSFAAGPKDNIQSGRVVARARRGSGGSDTVLEWEAPDRYVATLPNLGPGSTTVIRIGYVEWLDRQDGRRRWVYPMGGEGAPKLGELSIAVNVKDAGTEHIKAGLGAKRDRQWIRVRRSDYRPRADFVLELLDDAKEPAPHVLAIAPSGHKDEPATVRLALPTPFATAHLASDRPLRLVVVADVSAGTGAADLALIRQTVEAIFRQLGPKDRVALLAASVDALPLPGGKRAPLGAATDKRKETLLAALGKLPPGGGSDLGRAFAQAARLLPKGLGSVVYVGDGRPTLGALVPARLRDRLAARLAPPRIFAVGIGEHAGVDYLKAITQGLGAAYRVLAPQDAPRIALALLAHAARPVYRKVRVDLGPSVDRIYPRRPVTVEDGTVLHVLGRLRGKAPRFARVRGLLDDRPFDVRIPITHRTVRDEGDLRRRWAFGRVRDLLEQGAGRESVAEVGVRFGVVTPFSGMVVGAPGQQRWYLSRLPADPAGTFVPEALRGAPPAGAVRIALEPGWATRATPARSLAWLYQQALHAKVWTAARASFDRKAAARRDLSGRVVITVEVNPDGTPHKVTLEKERSSLSDADVRADLLRLVESVRLPPTPTGERFAFTQIFQFSPRGLGDVPKRCLRKDGTRKRSPESFRYLAVRRVLWRERLARSPSPVGAHRVWRGALACGEIQTDTDARALLRLMLGVLRTTRRRVDLYQRLRSEASWVRPFLRHEILRRVRTLADVRAVRAGLSLDGGLDRALLAKMLAKVHTDKARLAVARKFLSLSPESLTLRVLVLGLLERTGAKVEAERLAWQLRADPAADAGVRQRVAAFFWRLGKTAEARRALTEIAEMAPFDPWARRRLGRLLLALATDAKRAISPKGKKTARGATPRGPKPSLRLTRQLFRDAYRELETLAWLEPGDPTVRLLLAQAAEGMERIDQSLRFVQVVAEAAEAGRRSGGVPAFARLIASLRLAALRVAYRSHPARLAQVRARGRRMGIHGWARDLTLAITWSHPDAHLSLWLRYPGRKPEEIVRARLRGDAVGVEGVRLDRTAIWGPLAGDAAGRTGHPKPAAAAAAAARRNPAGHATEPLYLEIRTGDPNLGRVRTHHGRLWLLEAEARPKERLRTRALSFSPRDKIKAKAFLLYPDGRLVPTRVVKPKRPR